MQDKIKTIGENNVNEAELELASNYKNWAESALNIADLRKQLKSQDALEIASFIN